MANVFAPLLPTAIEVFYQQLASKSAAFEKIARMRSDPVARLKLAELRTGGSAGFGTWDGGDVTPGDFTGLGSTAVSSQAYKKQMFISKYDAEDNPMVVADIASRLADEAAYKLGRLVWTALGNVASTDHPTVAGKKICDAHTFGTNKGTSALSLSSLNAARVAMRGYKNHDGDIVPFEGYNLFVPPSLETMGKQLIRSVSYPNSPTNGGESDIINSFNGSDSGIVGVEVAPLMSDSNDWALICGASDARKPFDLWLRSPIELIPTIDPKTQGLYFNVSFRASVLVKPDCDTSIFYSSVA